MNNNSKSRSFNVRMDNDLIERIDAGLSMGDARSRNDYINKSVQFYNAYMQLEGGQDEFSKILGDIVEDRMKMVVSELEVQREKDVTRLARNQFKIATELAKVGIIMADNLNVPKERMTEWHVQARRLSGLKGCWGLRGGKKQSFYPA